MKLINVCVLVLAVVVCEVLSVPVPPTSSQPDPKTAEAIKAAIARRAATTGGKSVPGTGTNPDGDLQTDETILLGLGPGYGGWGYPWGGWGLGGYGLGLGYGGLGWGGLGYGLGYGGWGGYGLGYGLGYGGYGLGLWG
jgi:hypothetical protein